MNNGRKNVIRENHEHTTMNQESKKSFTPRIGKQKSFGLV